MIREALAGTRIAITGSTGFLGTALVERLLRQIPDVELVLLVRPGRRGADVRVERELLRNDAFDRLRSELGPEAFANRCANQVHVVAADIGVDGLGLDEAGRELLASCTTIIHSAAAVAFDNPLDAAIEVNLLGPVRLVAELNRLASERDQSPPHLVAVSTCYVAGSRRGDAPEQLLAESPFSVDADWRAEVEAARRSAIRIEDASREATRLGEFAKRAHRDLGAAGTPALAAKTEQLRTRWVKDQLVEAGRARAASLGFPDAYAYTKALAEQAVVETRANLPVSIVRPSIIESAWEQPVPGWIRGFRMAEPIIIAYGRGLLREFPGIPEGIIDVIPVDLVVGAICAVAAEGPSPEPSIVQVASGGINPFRYGQLVDLAHEWFGQNPLYDEHDQPISPNRWSYPGRGRVQTQLQRAVKGLSVAERAVHKLPVRGSKALIGAELESRRDEVERALGYVELYGAYVECE
ncbi:MAG: SDR family oxidoreductase, partial [Acidimicrobiales bacterium]|nr:SDR family oxidoreductase [Acidimicrobiales bacterium]